MHAFTTMFAHTAGRYLRWRSVERQSRSRAPTTVGPSERTERCYNQNAKTGYRARFNAEGTYNLRQVPRCERYRGFWFMNMNPKAIALEKYLAGAKEWIDLIIDQSDAGIEVTSGEQEFIVNCNWKPFSENQIDSYHGISLHSSYFRYAMKRSGEISPSSRPSSTRGNPGGSEMGTARSEAACAPGGQSPIGCRRLVRKQSRSLMQTRSG